MSKVVDAKLALFTNYVQMDNGKIKQTQRGASDSVTELAVDSDGVLQSVKELMLVY